MTEDFGAYCGRLTEDRYIEYVELKKRIQQLEWEKAEIPAIIRQWCKDYGVRDDIGSVLTSRLTPFDIKISEPAQQPEGPTDG